MSSNFPICPLALDNDVSYWVSIANIFLIYLYYNTCRVKFIFVLFWISQMINNGKCVSIAYLPFFISSLKFRSDFFNTFLVNSSLSWLDFSYLLWVEVLWQKCNLQIFSPCVYLFLFIFLAVFHTEPKFQILVLSNLSVLSLTQIVK